MNVFNIAPKNSTPLYAAYACYHGIEICVEADTLEKCHEELEAQLDAIEVIEMAEDSKAA